MLTCAELEPKKTALGDFGTFLRTHYGADVVVERAARKAVGNNNVVVSGFRSPLEAEGYQARGGFVIYIDASQESRYARIKARGRAHDVTSLDDLKRLDLQEHDSKAPMAENLFAVKKIADAVITNDDTIEELHTKLDTVIAEHLS